jgi:hypothetical protein
VVVVSAAVQSWSDLAADLVRKVPSKIDVGPVYTHDPRQRAKYTKGEMSTAAVGGGVGTEHAQVLMFGCTQLLK